MKDEAERDKEQNHLLHYLDGRYRRQASCPRSLPDLDHGPADSGPGVRAKTTF